MIRRIVLHGKLKKLWSGDLRLDAATVAEAISGMCQLTSVFNPVPGKEPHRLMVAGYNSKDSFFAPLGDDVEELHIFPAFVGGKQQGALQVIVGVVIMVAAIILQQYELLPYQLEMGSFSYEITAGGMFFSGLMMAAGGVLSMLSPTPKVDTGSPNYSSSTDPEASKYLGGPQNTTKIKTRIPILYGRTKAYGQILALGLQAKDVAI